MGNSLEKNNKIKVLVVDDSTVVCEALSEILNNNSQISVIGTAANPYLAVEEIAKEVPDVITLDLEMPRMNGLTFLKKLMQQHPIPVVVISSLTGDRTDIAIRALELGAVNIITKPRFDNLKNYEEYQIEVCDAVKSAALSKSLFKPKKGKSKDSEGNPQTSGKITQQVSDKLIVIGASTGGTEVLANMLKSLKNNLPPILVVQHMPGEFTPAFAQRLNNESQLLVKEAEHLDTLYKGHVYIANGYKHLVVGKIENRYVCMLEDGEMVNRHRPSVDVLFHSAAKLRTRNVMGILLTGMGVDGAKGLLDIKEKGGICIAQDEASSVVFGMPKEAVKLGATNFVGNPPKIIEWVNNFS